MSRFRAALLILLLPPLLQLPSEQLRAPSGTWTRALTRHQLAGSSAHRGDKEKRVTFSVLASVGPVLVILVYLLHAHGGELTIAAKQSLCLP